MVLLTLPPDLEIGVVPRRIYCNRDLVKPLLQALENLITRRFATELRSWDGCFNIRRKKGGVSTSLHAWGLAIDCNAAWNGFGKVPVLSAGFVKCFTDAGFDWGGTWGTPDGMHMQLREFPK